MDEMAAYRLYTVIPRLVSFIEQLTNWYIKLNRRRLKGGQGVELQENYVALATLFEVIFTISKAMVKRKKKKNNESYSCFFVYFFRRHHSLHLLPNIFTNSSRDGSQNQLGFFFSTNQKFKFKLFCLSKKK